MTTTTFAALGVAEPLLRALAAAQHHTPTPIQAQAIPVLLAGKDVLGIAQTGGGEIRRTGDHRPGFVLTKTGRDENVDFGVEFPRRMRAQFDPPRCHIGDKLPDALFHVATIRCRLHILDELAAHCRQLANKARETQENAMAEAAAPVLWAEINTRASQAKFAEADVKTLRERVGRFDKEFGKTQFAATNKDKLDAVKAKIIKLTATNMVVNGDFESGTFDGWKKTGGTNSGKITTDFGHGKYSLIGHIQPDYNTTLTQALTLEPQAEYRVSCWIRHGRGSLDMAANSGLYIIEGEGDRRDEDTHRIRFAPKARVNEWVQVEMHFTPQVANCRVEVFMRQRSKADDHYIMYLDDVEVVRVLK